MKQMASSISCAVSLLAILVVFTGSCSADQLSEHYYSKSCPKVLSTVKSVVQTAVSKERRMGASLLRLFFHDCFVNVYFLSPSIIYKTYYTHIYMYMYIYKLRFVFLKIIFQLNYNERLINML